jgi:hypothetical protein
VKFPQFKPLYTKETKVMPKYFYSITPTSTDGEYQSSKGAELTEDEYIEEIRYSCLLGGEDDLPEGTKDIRGFVQNGNGLDIYIRESDDYENFEKYFGIKIIEY